jgi:hypothetical protein
MRLVMSSIIIKSTKVLAGLMMVAFHPKMIDLAQWIAVRVSEVIFTSAYRPKKIHSADSGIAATNPCRHLDMRSYIYEDPHKIADDINKHWQYDAMRPYLKVAILHNTGLGDHIHLQVHDKTVYLGG